MFEKINYLAIAVLVIALSCALFTGGKKNWKESEGRDFYAMGAQSNVSEKEKEARIEKKFGKIETLIDEGKLEKALLSLKQMEPTNKKEAHLYFLQGKVYAKMTLYKESITNFLKAVKYDPDYVDEGCLLYKGNIIKEVTLDALEHYKNDKDALKLVYTMQRRLAGSCE